MTAQQEFSYQDQNYIIVGTIIITLCVTFIGTDHSLQEILNDSIIIKKLLFNTVLVLIAWFSVRAIIQFFDKKMPWRTEKSKNRWVIQIPLTLTFTGLLFLIDLYARTLLIPDWKLYPETVWTTDFPVSMLFGLSFNFLYYHWWTNHQQATKEVVITSVVKTESTTAIPASNSISVKKGKKVILISQEDIAYAFRLDDYNYLVTYGSEKHLMDYSLNALEKELSPTDFFRLNRQLLAHRSAIQNFQILSNRHLQVELSPNLAGNLLVNKNKAPDFKKWINGTKAKI